MKRSSANLKLLARQSLDGNFSTLIAALFIMGGITVASSMLIAVFDIDSTFSMVINQLLIYIISVLISLLSAGFAKLLLNINRKEPRSIGDIFYAFLHNPDRFLIVNSILLLVGILASLPFDIPSFTADPASHALIPNTQALLLSLIGTMVRSIVSILLSFFFGLSNYLLLDNPEMGALDSMRESLRLMKGNKGRFFHLYFSFLPLEIISIFTCGIGYLWLTPYKQSALLYFYMDVIGELDRTEATDEEVFVETFSGEVE